MMKRVWLEIKTTARKAKSESSQTPGGEYFVGIEVAEIREAIAVRIQQ